jgi:hypothetical protein
METRVESSQTASARSLSSSPSSSSSFSASIVPLISYSPVQTTEDQGTTVPAHDGSLGSTQLLQNGEVSMAESGIEGLIRFVNVTGSGGMEWKDVDERFDRLALNKNGPEPVVKWSDFGFCIGENHNIFFFTIFVLTKVVINIQKSQKVTHPRDHHGTLATFSYVVQPFFSFFPFYLFVQVKIIIIIFIITLKKKKKKHLKIHVI